MWSFQAIVSIFWTWIKSWKQVLCYTCSNSPAENQFQMLAQTCAQLPQIRHLLSVRPQRPLQVGTVQRATDSMNWEHPGRTVHFYITDGEIQGLEGTHFRPHFLALSHLPFLWKIWLDSPVLIHSQLIHLQNIQQRKKQTVKFACKQLLSHFSCVRLCATPQTAAYQAPPSLGFSRQEH